jgi:hypothetical protein
MTNDTSRSFCHSADVRMELRLKGDVLPITQLGRDFLILANPIEYPPADGEISLSVDGEEDHWRIRLPEGLSPSRQRSKIAPCPNSALDANARS